LPINGSQDDKIKIKDLLGLKVGDWKSWTPTKGCVQPYNEPESAATATTVVTKTWIDTVMTNKTVEEVVQEGEQADIIQSDSDNSDNSDVE